VEGPSDEATGREDAVFRAAVAVLLAVPAVHPTPVPCVGASSHLLWWVHVLPLAMVPYREGRNRGSALVVASVALVIVGERTFGADYGQPAERPTAATAGCAGCRSDPPDPEYR